MVRDWQKTSNMADVVLTQGARGATIITKERRLHVPTQAISEMDIVDSVGCGDTFAMAVSYSYYQNHDLYTAVKDGHHAARHKLLTVPAAVRAATDNLYT
jgi:sugar/nucleoside kinase (ribokinase family)